MTDLLLAVLLGSAALYFLASAAEEVERIRASRLYTRLTQERANKEVAKDE